MRWRTKQEVVSGKGQFTCGARGCSEAAGLCSYEVNFAYVEAGQPRQALVKLRLCAGCGQKLNYGREQQYRKVGLSAMELQEQQQQAQLRQQQRSDAGADEGRQRHSKRKHKHRGKDGKGDGQQDDEGRRLGDRGVGSKRRRRSADGEGSDSDVRHLQQRRHSAPDGAAGAAAAAAAGAADDGVGEADIDRWLDSMFDAPAAQ
eukprot:GHRQ01031593.1.p1 GENE.GHRQ01031593.1~~GHRQ01031593.1.p1  ORF type:complete len:203 (+),score=86.37 GHRQ01031593.1:320-928(+)